MEVVNVIVQGVLLGGLYALFAAGLSLIFGVMRLVNIAHGDLIVVAAYFAYFTMQALDIGPFTSLIVVVPVIASFGYVLQRGLLNFALGDDLPKLIANIDDHFEQLIRARNLLGRFHEADAHLHLGEIFNADPHRPCRDGSGGNSAGRCPRSRGAGRGSTPAGRGCLARRRSL